MSDFLEHPEMIEKNGYTEVVKLFKKRKETSDESELIKYYDEELKILQSFMTEEDKKQLIDFVIFYKDAYDGHVAFAKNILNCQPLA